MTPSLRFRDRFVARLAACLGWLLLHFIAKTSRLRCHYPPGVQELIRSEKPIIYTIWHRFQLLLVYVHRGEGIHALVSRSRDGELIAKTVELFGFGAVRGSSSRGGTAALLEILGKLDEGKRVVFTPDGPRGPLGAVHPGVTAAAQKSGVPIVAVGWAGNRVKFLSSWDRFMVPLPFSTFQVVYSEPVVLSPNDVEAEQKIRRMMDDVALQAEKFIGPGGRA